MKERPILFSTPMVRAILDGSKTVTRRVIKDQPIVVLSLRTDGIFVIYTTIIDFTNGKLDFETNTSLSERGLYGWQRWSDLFTYEVQRVWEEGLRGLVCVIGAQNEKGIYKCLIVPQQHQSNKEYSSTDLHGVSWNATEREYAGTTFGQQSSEQQTGKPKMGDSTGKLAGSKGRRTWERRGESSDVTFIGHGERSYSLGYRKGYYIQKAACKGIGRVTIRYTTRLPWEVGVNLWIRETWSKIHYEGVDEKPSYFYKADGMQDISRVWKPSIHMPKDACRLKLKIVSIRVERLHDITYQDAKKEGVQFRQFELFGLDQAGSDELARIKFSMLWASINGQESWDSNPWVWRIEFQKL